MKTLLTITIIVFLLGGGNWLSPQAQARAAHSMQFPKFSDVHEALAFLRTYPMITTQGVPLALLAKSLDMDVNALRKHVKADKHFETVRMGSSKNFMYQGGIIYAAGATPRAQINNFIATIPPARFKEGVPLAEVEANVKYGRDDWSSRQLRRSIGLYIDREKYVVHILGGDRYIFFKGYDPPQQIATYLNSMTKKKLEEGISLAQIVDNVSYLLDSWPKQSAHQSISFYLNKDRYAMHPFWLVDGVREHKIYPKKATPPKQLERCLQNIHPVMLMLGVPLAQIVAAVNYTCKFSSCQRA